MTRPLIAGYSAEYSNGVRQHFFLQAGLVGDLKNTVVDRVRIDDIPWPFAAFYLHLPIGSVPDGHGGHLSTIACMLSMARIGRNMEVIDGRMQLYYNGVIVGGSESGVMYHGSLLSGDEISAQPERMFSDQDVGKGMSTDMSIADVIKSIIVGSCIYMNKPGTKEYSDAVTRSEKPHSKDKSHRWSLRMVGERYVNKDSQASGTHASPAWHLRRGHIRRLEGKTTWVRPCFVGVKSAS
jgi:hypothetical protein